MRTILSNMSHKRCEDSREESGVDTELRYISSDAKSVSTVFKSLQKDLNVIQPYRASQFLLKVKKAGFLRLSHL